MNPQQEIEDLKARVAQLEKALAIVNLQTVRRGHTNHECRSMAKAFDEGRHFYLKVHPVAEKDAHVSSVVHRKSLELVIGEPGEALAKPGG